MLRQRPSMTQLSAGAIIAIFLVYCWISRYAWIPVNTYSTSVGSASSKLLEDIGNSSLGFEKIFVVSLPSRTDRRDGMSLAAALSNFAFEFVNGVDGANVPDKAIPLNEGQSRLPDPPVGCWRGHLDAIQEVVRRNLSSALIMEDDLDWDVRLKDQLRDFALSAHSLTQPLSSTSGKRVTELNFKKLPSTASPRVSPYGDNWDLLWVGHCGMRFPFAESKVIPKGRVVYSQDPTVPQQQYLWTISDPNELKEQYPNHTRVTHHVQDGICTLAYGITQKGARQLLNEVGLKLASAPFDILLRWFCEGSGEPNRGYHNCLTTSPSLFGMHLAAGLKTSNSDISDHGEGYQEEGTEVIRTSVRMNVNALLEGGKELLDQHPDVD
ncbi:hypothetical protein F4778DRAFT_771608 [Xylariomycetidae sp. FL2044]|nr:hypothetical protein F4778DRAFT_771608 [Xylariomycetidae sp. FL2044]